MSYGVKSGGRSLQRFGCTSWPPYADQRLAAVRGQTFAQRSVGPGISAMQGVRRAAIVRPMTLEQLSALAQIVGAGALLASLIFVGLQIRQNTQSQRVVAVESLAAAIAAINVPAMQSPALGTALATVSRIGPGEPRRACDRALFSSSASSSCTSRLGINTDRACSMMRSGPDGRI